MLRFRSYLPSSSESVLSLVFLYQYFKTEFGSVATLNQCSDNISVIAFTTAAYDISTIADWVVSIKRQAFLNSYLVGPSFPSATSDNLANKRRSGA